MLFRGCGDGGDCGKEGIKIGEDLTIGELDLWDEGCGGRGWIINKIALYK